MTGNNMIGIAKIKQFLQKEFNIKDLGKIMYFLDIELAYSKNGLFMPQRKYVLNLLKDSEKRLQNL